MYLNVQPPAKVRAIEIVSFYLVLIGLAVGIYYAVKFLERGINKPE